MNLFDRQALPSNSDTVCKSFISYLCSLAFEVEESDIGKIYIKENFWFCGKELSTSPINLPG